MDFIDYARINHSIQPIDSIVVVAAAAAVFFSFSLLSFNSQMRAATGIKRFQSIINQSA